MLPLICPSRELRPGSYPFDLEAYSALTTEYRGPLMISPISAILSLFAKAISYLQVGY